MSNEQNKAIVKQFVDAHNRQDMAQLKKLLAPDFKAHIAGMSQSLNRESYLQGINIAHKAFSSLIFTIQDMVGEGEKVVVRILAQGEHTGEYMGIAVTGKQIEFGGINIRRIVDGKVVEEWQTNDQFSLLRQLGALPQFS
jgi:steroid delta-isomerase-like uncharacterized protein